MKMVDILTDSKSSTRFGPDAMKFVNSPVGKELHLRGVNAKVVQAGTVRVGDSVKKTQTKDSV